MNDGRTPTCAATGSGTGQGWRVPVPVLLGFAQVVGPPPAEPYGRALRADVRSAVGSRMEVGDQPGQRVEMVQHAFALVHQCGQSQFVGHTPHCNAVLVG